MTWLDPAVFARRPIVYLEDQLYHADELLQALAADRPDLLAATTACVLERPGPDTERTIRQWLERYPTIQVAAIAPLGPTGPADAARVRLIDPARLTASASFARTVAALLRPGGLLVQDVHLSTLAFVAPDRWWESIFLATTVRGMFASRPPTVRFLSNKRGYSATFGRDLLEAGFDPRDVMDKSELLPAGVGAIARIIDESFPLVLDRRAGGPLPLSGDEEERAEVEAAHDLVLWDLGARVEVGGRLAARTLLRPESQETTTWRSLVECSLAGVPGPAVASIGARLAGPDAERAEITNLAARHLHAMRSRLSIPAAIVTHQHAYSLAPDLQIARVGRKR